MLISPLAVELDGFELEIANAAFRGGFNTMAHEALFNLIWSVKRTALRGISRAGQLLPRPPPHPVYPDRFRPSGVGDNTARKRKRIVSDPTNETLNRLTPPKFNPVRSLNQKNGTKEEPIALDSDDDKADNQAPANSSTKRLKRADKPTSKDKGLNTNIYAAKYTPWNVELAQKAPAISSTGFNKLPLGRPNRLLNPRASSYEPQTRPLSFVQSTRPMSSTIDLPQPTQSRPEPEQEIISKFKYLKARLHEAKTTINRCEAEMKDLFDRHQVKLEDDKMMGILQAWHGSGRQGN